MTRSMSTSEDDQKHRPDRIVVVYDGFVEMSVLPVIDNRIVARGEGHDLIEGCCIIHAAKTGFIEDQDTRAVAGVAVSFVRGRRRVDSRSKGPARICDFHVVRRPEDVADRASGQIA